MIKLTGGSKYFKYFCEISDGKIRWKQPRRLYLKLKKNFNTRNIKTKIIKNVNVEFALLSTMLGVDCNRNYSYNPRDKRFIQKHARDILYMESNDLIYTSSSVSIRILMSSGVKISNMVILRC
jgi:hypothetical protein